MKRLLKRTKNITAADSMEDLIDTSNSDIKNTTNESNNENNQTNLNNSANNNINDNMNNNDNTNDVTSEVIELLEIIRSSIENAKESYYILLDNLNALYDSYPDIYHTVEKLVKLPSDQDAKQISKLQKDIIEALKYLEDPTYLNSIIK